MMSAMRSGYKHKGKTRDEPYINRVFDNPIRKIYSEMITDVPDI